MSSCRTKDHEIAEVAAAMGVDAEKLRLRVEALKESNPMLGHRGCRLAVSYPEICEMQARAIFEAAVMAAKKTGKPVVPEVMVPLVAWRAELDLLEIDHRSGRWRSRHGPVRASSSIKSAP